MSPRARRALGVVAVLALLQAGAVLAYRAVEEARERESARAHEAPFAIERLAAGQAPDLELRRADGISLRLSSLQGKIVMVHFWATWCRPCEAELPGLIDFAREHQPEGVALLAVATDDDWSTIEAFFDGAIPPEVVRGVRGDEPTRYQVRTLPDTYLVDPSGQLAFRMAGARDWRSTAARATLVEAFSFSRQERQR